MTKLVRNETAEAEKAIVPSDFVNSNRLSIQSELHIDDQINICFKCITHTFALSAVISFSVPSKKTANHRVCGGKELLVTV